MKFTLFSQEGGSCIVTSFALNLFTLMPTMVPLAAAQLLVPLSRRGRIMLQTTSSGRKTGHKEGEEMKEMVDRLA